MGGEAIVAASMGADGAKGVAVDSELSVEMLVGDGANVDAGVAIAAWGAAVTRAFDGIDAGVEMQEVTEIAMKAITKPEYLMLPSDRKNPAGSGSPR
jgi:hypothetical protein